MQRGLVPPTASLALAVTLALGTVLLSPDARATEATVQDTEWAARR